MKKIVIGVVIILAALAAWKFWSAPQNLDWQVYQNTMFWYSVKYPASIARINTSNEYSGDDLTDEWDINFGVPGKTTLFEINVDYFSPEVEEVLIPKLTQTEIYKMEERRKLFSMDLKSYAEKIREIQINDTNPYTNAKVGDFQEIIFAGKTAYSFSLNDAFSNTTGGGYTLGKSQTYNYVITENSKGQKIIIHYLIGSETYPEGIAMAKKMMDSFSFLSP